MQVEILTGLLYHTLPRARRGRGEQAKKEVAEDNSTASTWGEFHKRIEVRGDSERAFFDEELDNWLERLSEEETESLTAKLEGLRFECAFGRGMRATVKDAFMVVAAVDWHLKQEGGASDCWRKDAAFNLHQFAEALRRVCELAGELEKQTGYSGRELCGE